MILRTLAARFLAALPTSGSVPWWLVLLVIVGLGGYVKGCTDKQAELDAYRAAVEAAGEVQRQRTLARIAESKLHRKEAEDAYRREVAALRARVRDTERRLRESISAGGGPVPAVPGAAESGVGGGDTVCFDRAALNRDLRTALERLLGGVSEVVSRGDEARAQFRACAEWALKEYRRSQQQ